MSEGHRQHTLGQWVDIDPSRARRVLELARGGASRERYFKERLEDVLTELILREYIRRSDCAEFLYITRAGRQKLDQMNGIVTS